MFDRKNPLALVLGIIIVLIIDAIITYMSLNNGFLGFINNDPIEFLLYMIIYPSLFLLTGLVSAGLFWFIVKFMFMIPGRQDSSIGESGRNADPSYILKDFPSKKAG